MGQFNCSKLRPGLVRLGQVSLDNVGLGRVRSGQLGFGCSKRSFLLCLVRSGQVRLVQVRSVQVRLG
jgi:hypothetical protein